MKTTAIIPLAATLAVIGAGTAFAAAPSVTSSSVVEGTSNVVQISHRCTTRPRCTYHVTTLDGTAKAGADYTPASAHGRVRKRHVFTATMPIDTANDDVCEDTETVTVRVRMTTRKGTTGYRTPETITDDDCATPQTPDPQTPDPQAPAPAPAPATPQGPQPSVAIPTNPDGAAVSSSGDTRRMAQSCTTAYSLGTPFPGSDGYTVAPCYVWARCPADVARCTPLVEHHVDATTHVFVLGYGKVDVYDAAGDPLSHKVLSCRNDQYMGTCGTTSSDVAVGTDQTVVEECDGFHNPKEYPALEGPPLQPGARVRCSVELTW
jgi:hypothetical protein